MLACSCIPQETVQRRHRECQTSLIHPNPNNPNNLSRPVSSSSSSKSGPSLQQNNSSIPSNPGNPGNPGNPKAHPILYHQRWPRHTLTARQLQHLQTATEGSENKHTPQVGSENTMNNNNIQIPIPPPLPKFAAASFEDMKTRPSLSYKDDAHLRAYATREPVKLADYRRMARAPLVKN